MPTRDQKNKYIAKLTKLLDTYTSILIVNGDNVGSKQFADIRADLRTTENVSARAEVLFGKNTLMRRTINLHENEKVKALLPYIKLNMGFVFTSGSLSDVRDIIGKHVKGAPAKAGAISDKTITIPAGPTGQPPDKTGFFQALNIPTKINRGAVEIIARVKMITEGEKVSASASVLLSMLDLKPFSFGIKVRYVYEAGSCYAAKVLDLSETDIMAMFGQSLNQAASLSLGLSYPSTVAVPHLMSTALKKLVAFSIEADFDLKIAEPFKAFLADPSAFAVAGNGGGDAGGEAQKEEKKEEEEEDDGGFDLDSDEE